MRGGPLEALHELRPPGGVGQVVVPAEQEAVGVQVVAPRRLDVRAEVEQAVEALAQPGAVEQQG